MKLFLFLFRLSLYLLYNIFLFFCIIHVLKLRIFINWSLYFLDRLYYLIRHIFYLFQSFFKMGQPRPPFWLVLSFRAENLSSQQDWNSDHQSRRHKCWPLDHHLGPNPDKLSLPSNDLVMTWEKTQLSWCIPNTSKLEPFEIKSDDNDDIGTLKP